MTSKTHSKGGIFFALIILNFFITKFLTSYNIMYQALLLALFFYFSYVGSLFPDIDQKGSTISRQLPILAKTFGAKCRHRGFTHSLLFMSILTLILGIVLYLCDFNIILFTIAFGFIAGNISHLILDLLTEDGIELFFPCKINFKIGFINTGSKVEKFITVLLKYGCYILIGCNIVILFFI